MLSSTSNSFVDRLLSTLPKSLESVRLDLFDRGSVIASQQDGKASSSAYHMPTSASSVGSLRNSSEKSFHLSHSNQRQDRQEFFLSELIISRCGPLRSSSGRIPATTWTLAGATSLQHETFQHISKTMCKVSPTCDYMRHYETL